MQAETKKDERQIWLDSLREGDEVAYRSVYGTREYSITTVTKRTPTGRIVCNGITWESDGTILEFAYSKPGELVQVTDEIRNKVRKHTLVCRFRNLPWDTVPLDTLIAVNELMQGRGVARKEQ